MAARCGDSWVVEAGGSVYEFEASQGKELDSASKPKLTKVHAVSPYP